MYAEGDARWRRRPGEPASSHSQHAAGAQQLRPGRCAGPSAEQHCRSTLPGLLLQCPAAPVRAHPGTGQVRLSYRLTSSQIKRSQHSAHGNLTHFQDKAAVPVNPEASKLVEHRALLLLTMDELMPVYHSQPAPQLSGMRLESMMHFAMHPLSTSFASQFPADLPFQCLLTFAQ